MTLENGEASLASQQPIQDRIEEGTKVFGAALLSALPVVGGSLATAFTGALAITDRHMQERWLGLLAQRVDELSRQSSLEWKDIVGDEKFAAAVVKALRVARETTNEQKHNLLVNAACNSGSWAEDTEAVTTFFIRLLERYEPEHVLVLSACDDPKDFLRAHSENVGNGQLHWIFANIVYKGTVEWEPLARVVLQDLRQDGFITDPVGLGYDLNDAPHRLSTPFGASFLRFCSAPLARDAYGQV